MAKNFLIQESFSQKNHFWVSLGYFLKSRVKFLKMHECRIGETYIEEDWPANHPSNWCKTDFKISKFNFHFLWIYHFFELHEFLYFDAGTLKNVFSYLKVSRQCLIQILLKKFWWIYKTIYIDFVLWLPYSCRTVARVPTS